MAMANIYVCLVNKPTNSSVQGVVRNPTADFVILKRLIERKGENRREKAIQLMVKSRWATLCIKSIFPTQYLSNNVTPDNKTIV